MFEPESPCVDQWGYGDIIGFSGLVGDSLGQIEHIRKQAVGTHVCIVVDMRDDRLLVERRQGIVHLLQFFLNFRFQVLR